MTQSQLTFRILHAIPALGGGFYQQISDRINSFVCDGCIDIGFLAVVTTEQLSQSFEYFLLPVPSHRVRAPVKVEAFCS